MPCAVFVNCTFIYLVAAEDLGYFPDLKTVLDELLRVKPLIFYIRERKRIICFFYENHVMNWISNTFIVHLDKLSVLYSVNYDIISSLASKGLSIRKMAEELKTSPTNTRYWLKKFNLKTIPRSDISEYKFCPSCKVEKLKTEFYNRRNGKGNSVYCRSCTHDQTINRQRDFKQKCIDYKGGKCVCCGYSKCNNALDFHHLDSDKKEFGIAQARLTSFNEDVKRELDNCALVCANCHREIHAGIISV